MKSLSGDAARITHTRFALLFGVFFLIAFGLGYPVLNRYDPRGTPGLSDVRVYAAMVTGTAGAEAEHMRFRVLVPGMARPIWRLARRKIGSWDAVIFSLLMANSLFVAGTALLIVILGRGLLDAGESDPSTVGLVGALLYLLNFAIPNLRLVGLVDAGEGFFLLAVILILTAGNLWALPVVAVLGALAKESFVPLSIVMTGAWWLTTRRDRDSWRSFVLPNGAWILVSWILSLATVSVLQWSITGMLVSPLQFGLSLHRSENYWYYVRTALADRNLWYIFAWLLPAALFKLRRLPRSWMIPIGAGCLTALAMDGYYGGAPGTAARALFSIAGPILSLSAALLLLRISS